MSKMKQLFKGYHNNKSEGRFFVVFVVITPVSSAGAKKKKSQNRQVWTPFPLTRVKTDISSSVRLHNTSLCEQLRESQYGASLSVCWFEIERQFEDVFVRVCVSSLNSWEMFNKKKQTWGSVESVGVTQASDSLMFISESWFCFSSLNVPFIHHTSTQQYCVVYVIQIQMI